ncbi:hypothetical protein B0H11DRAFT_2104283 [Mycena galericulata]|nr:hypothetical protein B0H11DRAFT_2104283 [Mycena galericulata]
MGGRYIIARGTLLLGSVVRIVLAPLRPACTPFRADHSLFRQHDVHCVSHAFGLPLAAITYTRQPRRPPLVNCNSVVLIRTLFSGCIMLSLLGSPGPRRFPPPVRTVESDGRSADVPPINTILLFYLFYPRPFSFLSIHLRLDILKLSSYKALQRQ